MSDKASYIENLRFYPCTWWWNDNVAEHEIPNEADHKDQKVEAGGSNSENNNEKYSKGAKRGKFYIYGP